MKDLDEICPKTRHPVTRKKCLQALQKHLDETWRSTQSFAKVAGVKHNQMAQILRFLKACKVVESQNVDRRHTYWRLTSEAKELKV